MREKLWTVVLVALVGLALFWAPFALKTNRFWGIEFSSTSSEQVGMETIVQNFDGLNFIVVAKSWYNPEKIEAINRAFLTGNEPGYFAAHYPLTAGLVWLFDRVTTGPRAVLATIVLSNILLAYGLYVFFAEFVGKKHAWWLSLAALFWPARMLSTRGVLSTETLFIPLTLLSLVLARRGRHSWAAVLGSLAVLTRSPGIILFAAYAAGGWQMANGKWQIKTKQILPYLLMPVTLVALWGYYGWQYGSFWAYFQSGDNLHLFFPPFRVFGTSEAWISGIWREEIIYLYLVFTAGLVLWWQKARGAARYYPALLMLTIIFVSHRDIARYALPVSPFVIAGFASCFEIKWVKWLLLASLVPIYLYAWQFVLGNVQPVADWTALL